MVWNLNYDRKSAFIWLTLLLLKYPDLLNHKMNLRHTESIYSSVWCFPSIFGKTCSFNNLCYNPKFNHFLFILTKDTVISGITNRKNLQEISTSWLNHSHFYLKLVLIDNIKEYSLIKDRTIIMSRFKPDNIMHIIHDDLLPLYVMYKRICFGNVRLCSSKTLITFADTYNNSNILYGAFSNRPYIYLHSVDSLICFSEAHVGLDSDSVFYQYGYDKPQSGVKPFVSGELLYEFSEYILSYLKIERTLFSKCTLIGRKVNRKILNEKYLEVLIKDVYLKKINRSILVNNLDISSHSIENIIRSIATSKLLLGMHGAGMVLAMFLPIGSITIELFPYGIVKKHVSAVYSMSKISGIHFKYFSWTNHYKINSLSHPEYPKLLGGFESISDSEKIRISTAITVPPVYCCHDPLYLHFMYQDTYVDYSIVDILIKSFKNYSLNNAIKSKNEMWFFPSQVQNLDCFTNNTHVNITWDPPLNVKHIPETMYRVTLSCSEYNTTYVIKNSFANIRLTFSDKFLLIWVQSIVNEIKGTDSHLCCYLPDHF